MYEEYNKLTLAEQKKLLREIDKLYRAETDKVKAEIYKILADKGKSQRDKITALGVILGALWVAVGDKVIQSSSVIMKTSWTMYGTAYKPNPLLLSDKDISQLIGRTVKKRKDIIKWNRVIQSNTKVLDKRVSRIVKKGIAESKTARQIQAELEKTMMMNRGKAKAIARTETNFYKSESKMQVGSQQEKNGETIVKTWVYTHLSNEPRESHLNASGQMVEGLDSYFSIGGYKTKAPQHFGLASQDINCTCDMRMEFK
jgi:hypothetical protein